AVTVEYGLEDGRFWLPRTQTLEGEAQVSFVRAPLRFEQRFTYLQVNGLVDVPEPDPVVEAEAEEELARAEARDSLEAGVRVRTRAERDSARAERDSITTERNAAREAECEATGSFSYTRRALDGRIPVTVRMSCDTEALATSSALPASIYDEGDSPFGTELRDE